MRFAKTSSGRLKLKASNNCNTFVLSADTQEALAGDSSSNKTYSAEDRPLHLKQMSTTSKTETVFPEPNIKFPVAFRKTSWVII